MQPKFTLNEKGMLHIENLHFHIPSGNENACRFNGMVSESEDKEY